MDDQSLPPGQFDLGYFPRYGLWQFSRYMQEPGGVQVTVSNNEGALFILTEAELAQLDCIQQSSDFHCITSWSARNVQWQGYRFSEFYRQFVVSKMTDAAPVKWVQFRSADNYRTFMAIEDLLADDVLLAIAVNDQALAWEHGGPIRLVAPAHYGFKSAKHLTEIIFCNALENYRSPALHWHEHPRARVALEERSRFLPQWFWRYFGRLAIPAVLFAYRLAAKKRKRNS